MYFRDALSLTIAPLFIDTYTTFNSFFIKALMLTKPYEQKYSNFTVKL